MITKRVTRYYAECGHGFWKKEACLRHEKANTCWMLPSVRTCKTCRYGEYLPYEDDTGCGGYYGCLHHGNNVHSGAPHDIDYISVNCKFWKKKGSQ